VTVSLRPSEWSDEDDRAGFFGPDSITWRVHSDPSFSIGGLRALLLQALHPVAMDGVSRNSEGFRESPWPRLMRTAAYVDTLTFGTRREALRAVARRAGVPLTDDDADRYVAEQVTAAVLVGAREKDVPRSVAELAAYFERMLPSLAATPAAWDAWKLVVLPPMPAWVRLLTPARPAWGSLAGLAVATLPRWARRLYRLPGLGLTDAAATGMLRAFRQATLALPQRARRSPIVWAGWERVAEDAA